MESAALQLICWQQGFYYCFRQVGATAVLLTPVVMTAQGDGPMGQAPMSFFAPNPALAVGNHPAAASQELKHVVKQLHAQGIEVILQVCMHETTECNTAMVDLQICS